VATWPASPLLNLSTKGSQTISVSISNAATAYSVYEVKSFIIANVFAKISIVSSTPKNGILCALVIGFDSLFLFLILSAITNCT
jgi:hypothetical protein